jgi:SRSO17 transposase
METQRTFANMARRLIAPDAEGQNLQQFVPDSSWSAAAVLAQVRGKIAATPALRTGGVLLLDESADGKAGAKSAGAGRQHNGRLGKIEMSQVGTFLAFYKGNVWTWVDGELFLPEHWFTPATAQERQGLGVPAERQFVTKIARGWQMIQRVKAEGLPFEALACDDLYGRSGWFRRKLAQAGTIYMAEIPESTQVYLTRPVFGVRPAPAQPHGRQASRARVLSAELPVEVRQLVRDADLTFRRISVRPTERGVLMIRSPCAGCGPYAMASWRKNGWWFGTKTNSVTSSLEQCRYGQSARMAGRAEVQPPLRGTQYPGCQVANRLG